MKNVGIFLFNEMELLDFAGPYEVFSVTTGLTDDPLFAVFTVSEDGKMIRTINGLQVVPDYDFKSHPPIDLLIVPGGSGTKNEMAKGQVLQWLREQYELSDRTMSVCSGSRLLGKLGLLDHLEIITHHEVIPDMKAIAPHAVIKEGKRFVDNGKILTSAGISAGIDLSLYLVAKLYGKAVADKAAHYMEYSNWE